MKSLFKIFTAFLLVFFFTRQYAQDSAKIYYISGRSDRFLAHARAAAEDFARSIQIRPTDSAYYWRGRCKELFFKDTSGAMVDYTKAIELNPSLAAAYISRGGAKSAQGDKAGALADYNEAISLEPKNNGGYYCRAGIENILGNYDKAISDYTKSIELLGTKNGMLYYLRGQVKLSAKKYKSALKDFDVAISLDPEANWYFKDRAKCKLALKDIEGACQDLTRAVGTNDQEAKKMKRELCK